MSKEPYDKDLDEYRCGNILLRANSTFTDISVISIGTLNKSRGYSSFKFIPETKDRIIVATKTEEDQTTRKMKSFITGE